MLDEERKQLARKYAISRIGTPFDYQFSYHDDKSVYCTELVIKAFEHAGIDLKDGVPTVGSPFSNERVIPPDNLRSSPFLDGIPPTSPPLSVAVRSRVRGLL